MTCSTFVQHCLREPRSTSLMGANICRGTTLRADLSKWHTAQRKSRSGMKARVISFPPETQNLFVFGVRNGRLIDEATHYRFNPHDFARFVNSSSSYQAIR